MDVYLMNSSDFYTLSCLHEGLVGHLAMRKGAICPEMSRLTSALRYSKNSGSVDGGSRSLKNSISIQSKCYQDNQRQATAAGSDADRRR